MVIRCRICGGDIQFNPGDAFGRCDYCGCTTRLQPPAANEDGTPDALTERAFLSLEDGEFEKADKLCEMALNLDAHNVRAYLGKLMADLKAMHLEDLEKEKVPFDSHPQYQKILRFGDEKLADLLRQYNQSIRDRSRKRADAEAEADGAAKAFERTVSAYCVTEEVLRTESDELNKTDEKIALLKEKIREEKSKLVEMTGIARLFNRKKERELEALISQQEEQLAAAEKNAEQHRSVIQNAIRMQTEKPDHKQMVYETAEIFYRNGLYEKAAEQYIRILSYKDVSEIIGKDPKLKEAVDCLLPEQERYAREEEEEAESICQTALEKTKDAILKKKQNEEA